jgi:hypothetical protein
VQGAGQVACCPWCCPTPDQGLLEHSLPVTGLPILLLLLLLLPLPLLLLLLPMGAAVSLACAEIRHSCQIGDMQCDVAA